MAAGACAPAAAPLLIDKELTTMEDIRFDALTKSLSGLASRRDTMRVTMGGGIAGALAALGLGDAGAKKKGKGKNKKKCKKPKVKCKKKCCKAGQVCAGGKCATAPPAEECQFTKTATLWTLESNCSITKTIEIPDGVTLDGNNKTIIMNGAVANYLKDVPDDWAVAAAVLANGGSANVHDLTIRGGNLTGSCSETLIPEGLSFINTSGEIRNVTVEEIALGGSEPCGFGITATGTGGQTVTIEDVTASGCPNAGVLGLTRANTPGSTVNVDGATVTYDGPPSFVGFGTAGIKYRGGRIAGTIANAEVSIEGGIGIAVTGLGQMTGQVVEISDVTISGDGILAAMGFNDDPNAGSFTVNVTRADITLKADPIAPVGVGITFGFGSGAEVIGVVDDSIIRNGFAGITQDGAAQVTVQNSAFENSTFGVIAFGGTLIAHDNTFSGVANGIGSARFGSLPVDATISNNIIVGGPTTAESTFGVLFSDGATGTVSGNTISNFFDSDPSKPSCGIGVFENAGEVVIGTNDFPDPPGNEEDICLDIPVEPIELAGRKGKDALGMAALRQMRDRKNSLKSNDHAGRDRKQDRQKDRHGRAEKGRDGKHQA
jgi:hypothetical protein